MAAGAGRRLCDRGRCQGASRSRATDAGLRRSSGCSILTMSIILDALRRGRGAQTPGPNPNAAQTDAVLQTLGYGRFSPTTPLNRLKRLARVCRRRRLRGDRAVGRGHLAHSGVPVARAGRQTSDCRPAVTIAPDAGVKPNAPIAAACDERCAGATGASAPVDRRTPRACGTCRAPCTTSRSERLLRGRSSAACRTQRPSHRRTGPVVVQPSRRVSTPRCGADCANWRAISHRDVEGSRLRTRRPSRRATIISGAP